jgi:pectate lyase
MRTIRQHLRFETLESRDVPALPSSAAILPPPPIDAIYVDTVAKLDSAIANLQSNQTIVVQPGTYPLTRTLFIGKDRQVQNVTIRGATNDFNDVVIKGLGMNGPYVSTLAHGISVYNAQNVTIANLSVGDVYYHALDLQGIQGADRVNIYHCRLFDAGQQIIKSSSGGGGVDDVRLEYSLIEYSVAPNVLDHGGGTGYVGGIHAH